MDVVAFTASITVESSQIFQQHSNQATEVQKLFAKGLETHE